jgi:peptidoglycan hydrolase FlgJ
MNTISSSLTATTPIDTAMLRPAAQPELNGKDKTELRQAFDRFVGETFFGEMVKAMRKTVGKPAYFYGGRAEEIFQEELDQTLAKDIAHASAEQFTEPMFQLFNQQRR